MSGFWSMEKVRDFESIWVDAEDDKWSPLIPTRETSDGKRQKLNAVTASLIYMLPTIEINEITAENINEVFIRIRMLEISTEGMLTNESGKGILLTLQDIQRHRGLRVGAGMPVRPFGDVLISHLRSQATEALQRATESATSTGCSST